MESETKGKAWHDPDDDISDNEGLSYRKTNYEGVKGKKYGDRLRNMFVSSMGGTPKWVTNALTELKDKKEAEIGGKEGKSKDSRKKNKQKRKKVKTCHNSDDDDDAEGGDNDEATESKRARSDNVYVNQVKPLCVQESGSSHFQAVHFHPTKQWALVANSTNIFIHNVDGVQNPIVKTYEVTDMKIRHAVFASKGKEIWLTVAGFPGFFWRGIDQAEFKRAKPSNITERLVIQKLIPSPDGTKVAALTHEGIMVALFSTKSKEMVGELNHSHGVVDAAFDSATGKLYSITVTGEFYEWDIQSKRCIGKYQDDGNIKGSTITVCDKYIACGSEQGVVNLYEKSNLQFGRLPAPLKTFMQLTTVVDSLEFSHDGNVLVFGTSRLANSFKMVFIPRMVVNSINLAKQKGYGHSGVVGFSPNSGYLSFGFKDRISLYRVTNYNCY